MYDADVTVVGAGVVGLAVAARLAAEGRRVLVIEKQEGLGLETSSRNSQVIHSGFNYPAGSLKARLCVEGRDLLYEMCSAQGIVHRRLGKLVVATDDSEVPLLEALLRQGQANGVNDLRLVTGNEARALEPNVRAMAALLSPSTGIVDAWGLMRSLSGQARERGATFAFRTSVVGIERVKDDYEVAVSDQGEGFCFRSRAVVNCAGLASDKIAALVGIDVDREGYRLHYCKGEYFAFAPKAQTLVSHLVYPAPEPEGAGLGVHITQDVEGNYRLGPNAFYANQIDYSVDPSHQRAFFRAAKRYLPKLEEGDLRPDFAGIRPKLSGAGAGFRDFLIRHEADRGLPGLVDLVGIESPGLTSSLAIARHVADLLRGLAES